MSAIPPVGSFRSWLNRFLAAISLKAARACWSLRIGAVGISGPLADGPWDGTSPSGHHIWMIATSKKALTARSRRFTGLSSRRQLNWVPLS